MGAIGSDIGHGVSDLGKHDEPKPSTDSSGKTWEDHVGTAGTVGGLAQDVDTDTKGSSGSSGSSGSGSSGENSAAVQKAEAKQQMAESNGSAQMGMLNTFSSGAGALEAGTG